MKKILILLAAICCCGCSSDSDSDTKVNRIEDVARITVYKNSVGLGIYGAEIEGHIYIIHSDPCTGHIIHAEHCPCKMK